MGQIPITTVKLKSYRLVNTTANKTLVVPKFWSQQWILNRLHSTLSKIVLFITNLIDMSFFYYFYLCDFGLPLPLLLLLLFLFFHSLNLDQLTLFLLLH